MSAADKFEQLRNKPIEAIQGINAFVLALFGLYLSSPFYEPTTQSSSNAFGDNILLRTAFTLVFFVGPALPTILGWFSVKFRTPTWRARACFYMFIGICTITLLRILAVGLNPPIWLFYLATGLTSAVLYLYWQAKK